MFETIIDFLKAETSSTWKKKVKAKDISIEVDDEKGLYYSVLLCIGLNVDEDGKRVRRITAKDRVHIYNLKRFVNGMKYENGYTEETSPVNVIVDEEHQCTYLEIYPFRSLPFNSDEGYYTTVERLVDQFNGWLSVS